MFHLLSNHATESGISSIFLWMLLIAQTFMGLFLFIAPNSLDADSGMYRWLYYRYFAWTKEDIENPPQFSERRVRLFAALAFLVGLVGTGLWSIKLFF